MSFSRKSLYGPRLWGTRSPAGPTARVSPSTEIRTPQERINARRHGDQFGAQADTLTLKPLEMVRAKTRPVMSVEVPRSTSPFGTSH